MDNQELAKTPENTGDQMKVVEGTRSFVKKETEESIKMKENIHFFWPATAGYALFFAFCMYKNGSGITFPFFMAGSLFYFCYSLKKLGHTLKKGSVYYLISVMLLAISTFCTGDERIIAFNKLGIFLLLISFLLLQFFDTKKWGLGKYMGAIVEVVFGCLGEIARPVQDVYHYASRNQSKEKKKVYYVLLGLVITVPIFLIIAALLASADAVFRQVTDGFMETVNLGNLFGVAVHIVFWYFAVYMLIANLCNKNVKEEVKDRRSGEPIIAITVTGMLSLLYLYFSWIQIMCLFLGKMELPEGYTYAKYAREGFFQLLAVAIMNLIIVLFCLAFFRESKVLRGVLTVMSLCTFVMIASSAMRMILYVEVYNLTFLRILVLWALGVLTFLFVGVLICIFVNSFPLFRYSIIVVTCFYLVLSFSKPDLIIAKVNLDNAGGKLDYGYLADLSSDAAPVLIPYLRENGFDLAMVDLPIEKKSEGELERALRIENDQDPYWEKVEAKFPKKPMGKQQPYAYGYYYLERIRDQANSMNLRNFNLSRYMAVREARK